MRALLTSLSPTMVAITVGGSLTALLAILVLWLLVGPGPRRRRAFRQVRRMLDQGEWAKTLELLPAIRSIARPKGEWEKRLNDAEGQALRMGQAERLADSDYEGALEYALQAGRVLGKSPLEARSQIQNAILEEARRLFAQSHWSETEPTMEMLRRALRVQTPCREASFWQALCYLRASQFGPALDILQKSRTGMDISFEDAEFAEGRSAPPAPPTPMIDPSLYIGAILLRQGRAKESLRYFTEANRLDANCPLVPLHVGCAMIGAGGDLAMAVRTLQRVLGPKGLQSFAGPGFWAEVFPENRSYVRKLASKYAFQCPLWGDGPNTLMRQAQIALAQGLQRLGQDEEAAALFDQVLKDGAPSHPVLRGLGLALARMGRFEDAYKSLRLAHDLEEPKDRLTTGYLALCAVKAKPAADADSAQNLAWAIRGVTAFNAPGDVEWADLVNQVFAQARMLNLPLSLDDQLYLCEHLTSVHACDPNAAAAFHQLFEEHPTAFRPDYAWLFAQAVARYGGGGPATIPLFEITLHDRESARATFAKLGWDFDAVERAYLERIGRSHPGQIPAAFGPDPLPRLHSLLLDWAKARETEGAFEDALRAVETFVSLAPRSTAALDRLAALQDRASRVPQAFAVLTHWHREFPSDPLPLIRMALLRARDGEYREATELLQRAHGVAPAKQRAKIAHLGVRLALHQWALGQGDKHGEPEGNGTASHEAYHELTSQLREAESFCELALSDEPNHAGAISTLAALRWLRQDTAGLAALAERCTRLEATEPATLYFTALAHAAGGQWEAVITTCHKLKDASPTLQTADSPLLGLEAAYLEGIAHAERRDLETAAAVLIGPASAEGCPCAPFAQGLLGTIFFELGRYDDASAWWQRLTATQRTEWKLNETLGNTQLLSAITAFEGDQFEVAADKFRTAGRIGCRDRRLGGMLLQSLLRAGQHAIYGVPVVKERT